MLTPWLKPLPLVAILRGLTPDEAVATGHAIVEAGFRMLEVPLNSPRPIDSIARLAKALGPDVLVGAGTVMTPANVVAVADAGGRLIVMPHADTMVIRAAKAAGLLCVPGVATPTEAFAALDAGADALKLFPAEQSAPAVLKAWRAVLPREVPVMPVGGISPDNMAPWVAAGAAGFGIGSALFAPGRTLEETSQRARAFAQAWHDLETHA
jgi:2-dehydro-3-deoxyphosphogalactonate aldolase